MRPSSGRGSRISTAAKSAIAPDGRDRIEPPKCEARLSVSGSEVPTRILLNLDTCWATHSRKRHSAGPPRVEPACRCLPPVVCYAIGAGKIVCLTLSFRSFGTIMAQIRDIKSGRFGAPPREPMPRRLAAIVAGDISGYSRLMQIDEEGTHNRVKRIERDLIEPSIVEHHGRLVKTTGDGFIAIFDSPVEAVRCSIVIQQNLVGRNAALPKHHWIEYRIG